MKKNLFLLISLAFLSLSIGCVENPENGKPGPKKTTLKFDLDKASTKKELKGSDFCDASSKDLTLAIFKEVGTFTDSPFNMDVISGNEAAFILGGKSIDLFAKDKKELIFNVPQNTGANYLKKIGDDYWVGDQNGHSVYLVNAETKEMRPTTDVPADTIVSPSSFASYNDYVFVSDIKLSFDSNWVASYDDGKIHIFNKDGSYLKSIDSEGFNPTSLQVIKYQDSDHLMVTNQGKNAFGASGFVGTTDTVVALIDLSNGIDGLTTTATATYPLSTTDPFDGSLVSPVVVDNTAYFGSVTQPKVHKLDLSTNPPTFVTTDGFPVVLSTEDATKNTGAGVSLIDVDGKKLLSVSLGKPLSSMTIIDPACGKIVTDPVKMSVTDTDEGLGGISFYDNYGFFYMYLANSFGRIVVQ